MVEKKNFAEQMGKIKHEAAEACLALFKEYSITEMELMVSVSGDIEGDVNYCNAVKLYKPESKHDFEWFELRVEYEEMFSIGDFGESDEWFSIGDGYLPFDWVALYDSICDTINHFLENDIPVSEWNSRESFNE